MHPYQTEDEIKTRKILIAIVLSIIAAYFLNRFLLQFPMLMTWWIDYPSVLGFFGLFIFLFDNFIWKLKVIQNFPWLLIPNLNGAWNVEIKSSQDDFKTVIGGQMQIRQTGSRILITLESGNSTSRSIHAAILPTGKPHSYEIMYNYINKPNADSAQTMNIHYGTAWYQISTDFQTLDGEYFTGRGRQTYGRLIAKRE